MVAPPADTLFFGPGGRSADGWTRPERDRQTAQSSSAAAFTGARGAAAAAGPLFCLVAPDAAGSHGGVRCRWKTWPGGFRERCTVGGPAARGVDCTSRLTSYIVVGDGRSGLA